MIGRVCAFAVALLAVASAALAKEDAKKQFKAYVLQVSAKEGAAYAHKDSAFFDKLYAPSFVTLDQRGVKNGKKVALFLLRFHFNMLQKVQYSTKLLSLDTAGNTGTIKVLTVMQGQMVSRHGQPAQAIKITRIEKQVFVKNGNEWQMSVDQDLKTPQVLQPAMTSLKPAGKG